MQFLKSASIGVLILITATGCETIPRRGDTEVPGILVTDGGAGLVATNTPGQALRMCPDGGEPQSDYVFPERVYPKTGGPVPFTVLASDVSGIREIRIQLNRNSLVSGLSPAAAMFSDDESYSHGAATYVADFITLDVSGETPLTARTVSFTYAGPVPGIVYVSATDFNGNTGFVYFVVEDVAAACN